MTRGRTSLEQIFETQIQTLALTLRPSTVYNYRTTARHFLAYLRTAFPQLRRPLSTAPRSSCARLVPLA